jgi:transposase
VVRCYDLDLVRSPSSVEPQSGSGNAHRGDLIRRGRQPPRRWKLYGSLSRPDSTHRDSQIRAERHIRLQRSANDPQPPALAGILQAGGHRFDPGWLHRRVRGLLEPRVSGVLQALSAPVLAWRPNDLLSRPQEVMGLVWALDPAPAFADTTALQRSQRGRLRDRLCGVPLGVIAAVVGLDFWDFWEPSRARARGGRYSLVTAGTDEAGLGDQKGVPMEQALSGCTRRPRRIGRPSKFTPEVQARILEALRQGACRDHCARYAGVGKSTLYRWLDQGEADGEANVESELRAFSEAVRKAEAEVLVRMALYVSRAAQTHWRAAAWFLERREPYTLGALGTAAQDHQGRRVSRRTRTSGRTSERADRTRDPKRLASGIGRAAGRWGHLPRQIAGRAE